MVNYGTATRHVGGVNSQDGEDVKTFGNLMEGQIVDQSSKIVMLIDTCGLPKYLTTSISGLTSYSPDYACMVVDGQLGQIDSSGKELLGCALVLAVPVYVVITKIDMITDSAILKATISSLLKLLMLPGINCVPKVIGSEDDVVSCVSQFVSARIVPIFMVSCVTGDNMPLLIKFLNLIPARGAGSELMTPTSVRLHKVTDELEFQIEDSFTVPDTGLVVAGRVVSGELNLSGASPISPTSSKLVNKQLYLGPVDHLGGEFMKIEVKSIHRQRRAVSRASAGQTCTLAIADLDRDLLRKGMVIIGVEEPVAYSEFTASMCVLYAPADTVANVNCGDQGLDAVLSDFNRKRKSSSVDNATGN